MLAAGKDGALLRFSLGNEHLKAGARGRARSAHLRRAVELDPGYTAAWKLLGPRAVDDGRRGGRARRLSRGHRGRANARATSRPARRWQVFARRIEKALGDRVR